MATGTDWKNFQKDELDQFLKHQQQIDQSTSLKRRPLSFMRACLAVNQKPSDKKKKKLSAEILLNEFKMLF